MSGDILVVDDNAHDLDLAMSILSGRGFDIRVATSGRRALAAAKALAPDLVLLDITLPDMDGYTVCARLKEEPATAGVPVIFISGLDGVVDKVRAFEAGGSDYVSKPFEPGEMAARVENHLKISRLQRTLEHQNAELVRSREDAIAASRAKSIFLANMSHELRTPLNGILGFVQLMRRDPNLTPTQRENLAVIMRSGEHLLGLINDVLSIAKIESGQATVTNAAFDLHRLLQNLGDLFRVRAREKGIRLMVEGADSAPRYVSGDQGKIRQVLINLLGNALKFTQVGSVVLDTSWEDGARGSGIVRFEVRDSGAGIAPEDVDRIFDAFVQTAAGRSAREGTGLGLAISRDFVDLMGGRIAVRSELGSGSAFTVTLPLCLADRLPEDADKPRVICLKSDQPPYRILVVDDKDENRTALTSMLSSVGFEVREAKDGQEALDVWREWRPQLIFMDLVMPVMDGFDTTRAIRSEEGEGLQASDEASASGSGVVRSAGAKRTVIIALSASVFENEQLEVFEAGCDDFVAKPFRESVIFERIATHLGAEYELEGIEAQSPEPTLEREDARARIAALPPFVLGGLRKAVTLGDLEAAADLVEAVESVDARLGAELRRLVRGYQLDQLFDLIEGL
jgi:signal transduction histidine kinase